MLLEGAAARPKTRAVARSSLARRPLIAALPARGGMGVVGFWSERKYLQCLECVVLIMCVVVYDTCFPTPQRGPQVDLGSLLVVKTLQFHKPRPRPRRTPNITPSQKTESFPGVAGSHRGRYVPNSHPAFLLVTSKMTNIIRVQSAIYTGTRSRAYGKHEDGPSNDNNNTRLTLSASNKREYTYCQ